MPDDEHRTQALERLGKASRVQVTLAVLINQAVAAQSGVNPTDLQCLNLLTLEERMTPSQLAEAMAMTKGGAVTAMIDRLEKGGYIRRVRSDTDRRQVLVEIVRGTQIAALMANYQPLGDLFESVTAGYDATQLDLLAEYTERSNAALGFAANSATAPPGTPTGIGGALARLASMRRTV